MDLLGVAAVLLDAEGRIVLWSPEAEELFGYAAEEALGQYAAPLLVHEQHGEWMIKLFAEVMGVGHTPADPHLHAWSISLYRLDDPQGRVLGVADPVADVTDRYHVATEAAEARRRLALIADGSARIGTTLEVEQTARELAGVTVPELADMATVHFAAPTGDSDQCHARRKGDRFPCEPLRPQCGALRRSAAAEAGDTPAITTPLSGCGAGWCGGGQGLSAAGTESRTLRGQLGPACPGLQ
ncbi:PAS domain S-box protein [Streptomyces lydicus]|uniref:PAS domain S-box protein n=1 Tax=Streptomyces lydicus TaxID=47763 RepID=UPI0036FF24B2